MPIQPNLLPSLQQTPFRVDGVQDTNNGIGKQISHANQPWTLRLSALTTVQTFVNNAATILGFDTKTFPPTYRAVGGNIYSLRFADDGSGNFPFSIITLPSFGYYDVRVNWGVKTATSGAAQDVETTIQINGATTAQHETCQIGAAGQQVAFDTVTDIFQANPGDLLRVVVVQVNTNAATIPSTANSNYGVYLNLRYLGLS